MTNFALYKIRNPIPYGRQSPELGNQGDTVQFHVWIVNSTGGEKFLAQQRRYGQVIIFYLFFSSSFCFEKQVFNDRLIAILLLELS